MDDLREEDIDKLSKLCRIECTKEEKEKLRRNLSKILHHVAELQEVNTEGVPCCNHVHIGISSMRDDEIGEALSREEFLNNAPAHTGGMIRVPPVIKF